MSPRLRPSSPRGPAEPDIHPALRPSNTAVPVTPGILDTGQSAYIEPEKTSSPALDPSFDQYTTFPRPRGNAESYFPPYHNGQGSHHDSLTDRTKLTNGAHSASAHPNLKLSGKVISATFCVPFVLGFSPNREWELNSRRGTSALFDSFAYLSSSSSSWKHTLVGWTGEIDRGSRIPSEGSENEVPPTLGHVKPLNRSSAPVPVDAGAKSPQFQFQESLRVSSEDRLSLEHKLNQSYNGEILPVWLTDAIAENGDIVLKDQSRWRKYAEHHLYTLFHYKQNAPVDGRAERKSWADYYRLNKMFADRILEKYSPGDIVLVHDFYLMLLPSLLRQRVPNIYIGFFLHVPFPSSEIYRCLTRRKEVLEGVLGANMIGFQSYSYSRHFSSCCTRILGFDSSTTGVDAYGAHVAVDIFPIGINAEAVYKKAFDNPLIEDRIANIREMYHGKKIIVGRDRLDSARGVAQKLQAFELLLERHPEWRDKVVLIQVTSPSGGGLVQDGDERFINRIADLAGKINGQYGSLSFTPVQHYPQYFLEEEYFALLRIADVGLITSVRDGMNTTSMEYVICQKDNHGPLIISEFSGTAGYLISAIHINPWDLGDVANAINDALIMPTSQRKAQHDKLYEHVFKNNVRSWTDRFFRRLLTNLNTFDQTFNTPALDKEKLFSQYRQAKKRLFMFDYDGTLTPIVNEPSAAVPTDRLIRILKTLASNPANIVWIISGRDSKFLEQWLGNIPELGFSAEHGAFVRRPRENHWVNLSEKEDMGWREEVDAVFEQYNDSTPGAVTERKKIALTWHYRNADPQQGLQNSHLCHRQLEQTVVKRYPIEVMTGKANLEVRPKFINKGEIAKKLVAEHTVQSDGNEKLEFVLCLGDDFTDEDMFRALANSGLPRDFVFSVTVGPSNKQTIATWHLLEPSDVISVISLLNGSTDAGNAGAVAVLDGTIPETRT
ncbi:glycosyltransferase family 20 protein [Patellaria atrata CBS 101060]|uniref:Glycosyltransferase family 20 protein n=1 Tax=Patellaria atrata CBS 101060 TaxID=1346257 RepID=A0A9P4VNU2_9PEZI|nr:glycosyltransferase family 20 protein [Patellaria atrata CBS 101060]